MSRSLRFPSGGILLPCQKYARAAKGLCPLESRPRGETFHAVGRSADNLRSPLDSVSGYGIVSTTFRVRPTRSACRRALGRIPERGNETGCASTAATRELVARSPHTEFAVERSILHCLPPAWENRKGGTPFARFFPPFLAGQEMEPPEASRKDLYKLQFAAFPPSAPLIIPNKTPILNTGNPPLMQNRQKKAGFLSFHPLTYQRQHGIIYMYQNVWYKL